MVFLYPEEDEVKGSACLFTALLKKCSERNVFALCRCISRRNYPPRFVALVPQTEEVDEANVQISPAGFNVIYLPFADDFRTLDPPRCPYASQMQVNKMKEIISKLRFKYRSDAFENPVLQKHYRNLEALALDMVAPEEIEDLIMPKVEQIDQRLGPLVQEFKDLVYPEDYNPDTKPAAKRKTADGGGGASEKKPKVELTEEELRAHVQNGTLGKLTVPVLKDACKQFGVRTTGTKKQELMDALTSRLADGGGGASEKKPKVELTEEELRAHVQNGTLGKLTVPVLKDACKQFGVRTTGTKKQELMDALTSRLGS
ncbi:hypothetical protein OJAV_G00187310 [Oryzias javanicus]|uniref:SAP domain-containing protein n=1 Tax=Oryzias javanicus TaxID=123683 RepID=A0A3S2LR22_ORYJA|nr:hypothetical protein OJAV_G00187310 [Oryzias javanicus]